VESWQPWHRFNLSRNPFGELTRDERAESAILDDSILTSIIAERFHATQWIGKCGRGKTSALLALWRQMDDASYVLLPEDGPCPAIPSGSPLMIDEAQRLPRSVRRSIFASGLPLMLATHRDLSRPLRQAGYQVHSIRLGDAPSPTVVRRILNRRLEHCRLGPGPIPQISLGETRQLTRRFGSDIRAIEHDLYERVQSQAFPSTSPPDHAQMQFVDSVG